MATRKDGSFYGNIGRCLQFQGRYDDALTCVKKSAKLLEGETGGDVPANRGWAAQWLGEILEKKGEFDLAYTAYRSAAAKWKNVSPQRFRTATEAAKAIIEKVADGTLPIAADWEIEQLYLALLK